MNKAQISYGTRENQGNAIRAVCDYIERHPRYATCQMQDSAELNLSDARALIRSGDIGGALAGADRAARYVFGRCSDEYHQITGLLGTD